MPAFTHPVRLPAKKQMESMIKVGTIPSVGIFQAATMVLRTRFTSYGKHMRYRVSVDLPVYLLSLL